MRRFESGCATRKKVKERDENFKRIPKLINYFNYTVNTKDNTAYDNVPVNHIPGPSTSSSEKNDLQKQAEATNRVLERKDLITYSEEDIQDQVTDCASGNYVSTIISENSHYTTSDPGLWPHTDDILRDYWVEKGPSAC